jgi:hypothetical protein
LLTEPGVGHGVDDARLFLVPADGGSLRLLVDVCSQLRDSTPWAKDSKSVFVLKEDEDYKASFFQVDISTGEQTAAHAPPTSPRDLASLSPDIEQPHLTQDGRLLYFEQPESSKRRIVAVHSLLPPREVRR